MNQLEDSLRLLDPVDPDAPAVDGEALLRDIVRTPVPRHAAARRRRPRARVQLAAATVVTGATALVLAMPARDDVDVVAAAFEAVSQGDTILHYRVRHSMSDPSAGDAETLLTAEVWQAGDGSRVRTLSSAVTPSGDSGQPLDRDLSSESVQTKEESRTYVAADNRLIVYDTNVPALPAPGGVALADDALGDPRTLLERARSGDEKVVELGEATVRGVPVLQFRLGECRMTSRKVDGGVAMTYRLPVIASVARDDYTPVRIEQDANCGDAPAPEGGWRWDDVPRAVADYVSFETLPATDENRRLLEMSPHPGARIIDGEDVDAAEERADRRAEREGAGTP